MCICIYLCMYNTVSVCIYVVYKCIFYVRMNKHLILYIDVNRVYEMWRGMICTVWHRVVYTILLYA